MSHPAHEPTPAAAPAPPRRAFFRWVTGGLGALAALALAVPYVGYVFGTWRKRAAWVVLGPVSDFAANETRLVTFDNPIRQPWDGIVAQTGVFVRREEGERFLVLAVNCAHLGCPVEWFPQSGLFMCPCHGGVYYANGQRASGPPPRGLYQCVWRVRAGNLEVQAPHYPTLHDTLRQDEGD